MGLQVYHRKRKFDVTPEPRGRPARAKGNQYVIQKHAARRLHYDLRLELDGVMKSWAVTRGPSLVPGEKRLAVHVEDHPIEYNKFEGTIPQGEYGGGTVHDLGPRALASGGRSAQGPREGPSHLHPRRREAATATWHLVRMRGRPNEKKENWLLIKAHDEWARSAKDPDILEEMPLSVVSGRSIEEIAEGKGKKRVWHSNRSVKENVQAGATRGNGGAPARKTQRRKTARSPRRRDISQKARARARRNPRAAARRCRTSSRRRSRPCEPRRRAVRAGCTRSSSTAIASRPGSIAARCGC